MEEGLTIEYRHCVGGCTWRLDLVYIRNIKYKRKHKSHSNSIAPHPSLAVSSPSQLHGLRNP